MSAGLTQYHPSNLLTVVKGIGPNVAATLAEKNILTIQDLLLCLPLRYEDRSKIVQIAAAPINEPVTIIARVKKFNQFFRSGKTMSAATIEDESGSLSCYWFNNPYLRTKLKPGSQFCFAGKITLNPKTQKPVFTQAVVENLAAETIHTGRIVPLYSQTLVLKQGSVRRVLKEILDHLSPWKNLKPKSDDSKLAENLNQIAQTDLAKIFLDLHFPDSAEKVVSARERLALEELLSVINKANQLKNYWSSLAAPVVLNLPKFNPNKLAEQYFPSSLPFKLTLDQKTAVTEILADLSKTQPMNRLLMGDVGSGKTVVAGIAAYWIVKSGHSAALVAPTQILAEQHFQTVQKILPELKIELITSATSAKVKLTSQPKLYIGTHAILNKMAELNLGLLIYDEQHRFGVKHRSPGWTGSETLKIGQTQPHLLTMSATPIPRTLMLSLFGHLTVSAISQPPHAKLPTKTWVVPKTKKPAALSWIKTQLTAGPKVEQGLYVCPFINPSETAGFENIAAVTATFKELTEFYGSDPKFKLAMLHGGMKPNQKTAVIEALFDQKIQLLVTTPIVEVGVDLPAAKLIVIEAAERFGLASLHQLRGRVGRAGQASFCLLFTQSSQAETKARLEVFSSEHSGLKLAELDLERRGAGDLFGTAQSGFGDLHFANWTNLSLINSAREIHQQISDHKISWQPLFPDPRGLDKIGQN